MRKLDLHAAISFKKESGGSGNDLIYYYYIFAVFLIELVYFLLDILSFVFIVCGFFIRSFFSPLMFPWSTVLFCAVSVFFAGRVLPRYFDD
jgi:hypothetical protein